MSSHIQQTFSLTVSSKVKTVHVIGTWDGYKGQLPLSKGSKPGKWTASFKFPAEKMQPGGTYWYYVSARLLAYCNITVIYISDIPYST